MKKFVTAALAGAAAMAFASAHAVPVDLELQLLVDVSGSVDSREFALQQQSYSSAFRSDAIQNAILGGDIGSIAVQLVYWSSGQAIGVDWYQVSSADDANTLADAIDAAARPFSGGTTPSAALNFGVPLFADNGFEGTRLVIDVSGDGPGSASATSAARDAALASGIDTINGIAIGQESVRQFYEDNVIGGIGAFVILAATFEDFDTAIQRKLFVEISGGDVVPLPAAAVFLASGMGGLAAVRRRKLKAA